MAHTRVVGEVKLYICAGFHDPLTADDMGFIRQTCNSDGPRSDVGPNDDIRAIVRGSLQGEAEAMFVVSADSLPGLALETASEVIRCNGIARSVLEMGNEPNINGWSPRDYAMAFRQTLAALRVLAPDLPVVTGGVSNTSKAAQRWLSEMLSHLTSDEGFGVGFHSYRRGHPLDPQDGFASRADEFAALRAITGRRPLWHTEGGWTMATRRRWPLFWKWTGLDAVEVGHRLATELRLHRFFGVESFAAYQINDGPRPHADSDRFGLRDTAGRPKQSALLYANECAMAKANR